MRLGILLLVLALASGCATLCAQGEPLSHLSFSRVREPLSQLSFARVEPLLGLRTYKFDTTSTATLEIARSGPTCPMPVARPHSDDPMPVGGGGGTPESMPVARSGCWNPLDPAY